MLTRQDHVMATRVFRRPWWMRATILAGVTGGSAYIVWAFLPVLLPGAPQPDAGQAVVAVVSILGGLACAGFIWWEIRKCVVVDATGIRVEGGRPDESWVWAQIRDVGVGNFTLVGVGPYLILDDGSVAWLRPAGSIGLGWTSRNVRNCAETIRERLDAYGSWTRQDEWQG